MVLGDTTDTANPPSSELWGVSRVLFVKVRFTECQKCNLQLTVKEKLEEWPLKVLMMHPAWISTNVFN